MKEFKIGDRLFVGVEVPYSGQFKIDGRVVWYVRGGAYIQSLVTLPPGDYKIIGLVKELTFEEMSDLNMQDHPLTDNTLIIEKVK